MKKKRVNKKIYIYIVCIVLAIGVTGAGCWFYLANDKPVEQLGEKEVIEHKENNEEPETANEESTQDMVIENQIELLPRDLSTIKEYLSTFPDDSDRMTLTDAYVNVHGTIVSGQDKWDSFYKNVQSGKPAEIVTVQYTTEGDAILNYLNFDGNDFYLVEDDSRDGFAGQGEHYREHTYRYLKIFDKTYEDREDTQYFMLVNDESLTFEELEEYWLSSAIEETIEYHILGCINVSSSRDATLLNDAVSDAIININMSKKAGLMHPTSDFATEAHIICYKQDDIETNNTITIYACP